MRPVDRLREAAREQRYWVLKPETGGIWTLRHLDDSTGLLSEPVHTSEPIGDNPADAVGWAGTLVDVDCWHGMSSHRGAHIEEAYTVVREIGRFLRTGTGRGRGVVLRIEDHENDPGLRLVTLRERWDATGLESDPFWFCEDTGFADRADMLRQISKWFDLDPDGWQTITEGAEYHHP